MFISTIVITHNRKKLTKYLIESYNNTTPKNAGELIIVDNASTDGTIEYLKECLDTEQINKLVLNKKNLFIGGPWNSALEKLVSKKTTYVAKCDNDYFFQKGWYENFKDIATKVKPQGIVVASFRTVEKVKTKDILKAGKFGRYIKTPPSFKYPIGGAFYLDYKFIMSKNLRITPFMRLNMGTNATILRPVNQQGLLVQMMPPYLTREKEKYYDPEHVEYYKETFGNRNILPAWQKRAEQQLQGEGKLVYEGQIMDKDSMSEKVNLDVAPGFQKYKNDDAVKPWNQVTIFDKIIKEPLLKYLKATDSFLDIGCGNGRISNILKKIFKHGEAIDPFYAPKKEFIEGVDFQPIFLQDFKSKKKFNLILFWGSFYLMPNYKEALEIAKKHLTKDGVILIVEDSTRNVDDKKNGDPERHKNTGVFALKTLLDETQLKLKQTVYSGLVSISIIKK